MKCAKAHGFAMAILFFLTACASTKPASNANVPPAQNIPAPPLPRVTDSNPIGPSAAEQLLIYAERIRWLAPSALESERMTVEQEYRRRPTAVNRLELRRVLGLRRAPFRDDARSRELLSDAAREPGEKNQPLRSFAMWLLQDLDDRWATERTLDDERRQRLALQKKLDQLKAVEEEMDRRASAR